LTIGNYMIFTISSRHIRVNRLFIVAGFLTFALTAMPHAGSAIAQSKSARSHARSPAPHTKAAPSKKTKIVVNPAHSAASIDRDLLLRLETTEKELERHLQIQTETTQRLSDQLNHRIDILDDQLKRLGLMQRQSTEGQGHLMAAIRLIQWLSLIALGLVSVLCSAVFFFVFQRKLFGVGFFPERRMHIDGKIEEDERGLEGQWKVGS
jgi:hypothetical protein